MSNNTGRPNASQWSDINAIGNARQHIGHAYNNTTHNYAGPTPHNNVPVKPRGDPIHGDFIRACRQGQGPRRLNFLLTRGADIDCRDEQQRTPLHHAALSGSVSTLSHLIDTGADIHASAPRFGTPLHSAASSGQAGAVGYLVDAGADADAIDEMIGTPLHSAAFCGSADTVRCLLESGAEIDKCCEWVGTPLSLAAAKANIKVFQDLLEHGADVRAKCGYFGSAAHMACAVGNTQMLQILQTAGVEFDRAEDTCLTVYSDILWSVDQSFPGSLGTHMLEDEEVITGFPVIMAIIHGKLKATKFCMDMDPHRYTYSSYEETWHTNERGRNPSSRECSSIEPVIEALDLDMLQLLLDRGVVPDWSVIASWIRCLGVKAHTTPSNGKDASACISLLIRHGLQTNSLDTGGKAEGDTLLISVMRRTTDYANYEIAKAVLQHGAQVNAVNHVGQTALMIVAGTSNKSRVQCVQLLCEYGAAVDLEDEYGRNALRFAETWGGTEGYEDVKQILKSFSQDGPKQAVGFLAIVKSWMSK